MRREEDPVVCCSSAEPRGTTDKDNAVASSPARGYTSSVLASTVSSHAGAAQPFILRGIEIKVRHFLPSLLAYEAATAVVSRKKVVTIDKELG